MKYALITGGLGFIGSNLVKLLLKKKIVNKCVILVNKLINQNDSRSRPF